MFRTQVVFVALFYLLSSTVTTGHLNRWAFVKKNMSPTLNNEVSIKELLIKVLAGIGGMLMIDLSSSGNPLWPALGLVAGFMGEIFPWGKSNQKTDISIIYFGAVFYLYPVTAVAGLGLALPNLLFGKDGFLSVLVFTSTIPVLFQYSAINPWLLVAAILAEFLTVIYFRKILWQRLSASNNPVL